MEGPTSAHPSPSCRKEPGWGQSGRHTHSKAQPSPASARRRPEIALRLPLAPAGVTMETADATVCCI